MTSPPAGPVLAYFCYGSKGVCDQAIYSILSLLHVSGGVPSGCRIVVYSDRPADFARLPVEMVPLDQATLDTWLGDSDYVHRRKSCMLIDALERFGERVFLIDSDTWFRRAPDAMFRRAGPGRACFHLCEGYLTQTGTPPDDALARQLRAGDYRLPSRERIVVDRRTPMWNTGVIGVHADDLPRVRAALALSDAIWAGADPVGAYGRKVHHAEQFAMGVAFADCRLTEAADTVYHYWPQAAKQRFDPRLPALVKAGMADRSPASLAAIYAARERETGLPALRDGLKMALRRLALATGAPVRGYRRSVGG
ncbi:hypothetical protein [Sphingomonas sp.]|uniref:hypothetical protein n=1 Tax=Sphingomonas sp. TaxID=28214 RepID=UPI003CC5C369